jgi:hypothetical protein
LSMNRILDEGVVALAMALGQGGRGLKLRELYMVDVGMTIEGHRALAWAVRQGGLPSLKRSDLRGNQL